MSSSSLDNSSQELSEMVMVDEQVVACEVEIDGYEMEEYEEEQPVEEGEYVQDPSAGEYYQYEEDPETVFLYDEDTSQLHQVDPSVFNAPPRPSTHHLHRPRHLNHVEEQEIDVQYVPSTSAGPSTSSGAPGPSQGPPTYYIRKTGVPSGKPIYSPVTFHTAYSEGPHSSRQINKRVIKRTHHAMGTDALEAMMEDSQTLKKLQTEINSLRKENEVMKKEYEIVHKRMETTTMVLAEAKSKHKDAVEEKKQLMREIAAARTTNAQLVKEMCPEPEFGFHN